MKNILGLIAINLLILVVLLALAEGLVRVGKYAASCRANSCDSAFLKAPSPVAKSSMDLRISQYDEVLGYAPRPGMEVKVPATVQGWNEATIATDAMGFRQTGGDRGLDARPLVIVAGDSFTFGDQVEGHQTWPACLERETGGKVLNGGVFGYGAAQSLLRIETAIERHGLKPDLAVLSVLIGADFNRDRKDFRDGLPRPAVIKTASGELEFAPLPDRNTFGSRLYMQEGSAARSKLLARYFYERSWLFRWGLDRVAPDMMTPFKLGLMRDHPEAASKWEIMDWTLARFTQMDGGKLFLLQYAGPPLVGPMFDEERAYLLAKLDELNIPYVDTYTAIFEEADDLSSLYIGHHSPKGNELVCQTIMASPTMESLLEQVAD